MFRHSFNCYLIERIKRENELQNIDKSRWYEVNSKCLPEELITQFHQLHYDHETDSFISNCYRKSASVLSMFLFAVARSILKIFMSSTSICGLLGCGSMFVFSEEQFRDFVIPSLKDHHQQQLQNLNYKNNSNINRVSQINYFYFEYNYFIFV